MVALLVCEKEIPSCVFHGLNFILFCFFFDLFFSVAESNTQNSRNISVAQRVKIPFQIDIYWKYLDMHGMDRVWDAACA